MGVTGDFRGLEDLRAKVAHLASGGGRRDLNRVLAAQADKLISDGFRQGRDPCGQPWKPLTSRTGQPLRDTGTLLNSLGPKATAEGFTVSTAVKYAAVHQYGAVIKPKTAKALAFRTRGAPTKSNRRGKLSGFVFAKSVTIPQRQYMPEGDVGPIWRAALERAADDHLQAVMGTT